MEEENSYSSFIVFNVTSTSSIPNEHSNIVYTINPDDNMLFRGPDPTILEVLTIPSVYETNVGKYKEYDQGTGYHLMGSGKGLKGSQFTNQEIQFNRNLYAKILFLQSDSSLLTRQNIKMSYIGLISAVLGSVFGLMGIIAMIMSYVEKKQNKISNKIKTSQKERSFSFLKGQIKFLKSTLQLKLPQKESKKSKFFIFKQLIQNFLPKKSQNNKVAPIDLENMDGDQLEHTFAVENYNETLKKNNSLIGNLKKNISYNYTQKTNDREDSDFFKIKQVKVTGCQDSSNVNYQLEIVDVQDNQNYKNQT